MKSDSKPTDYLIAGGGSVARDAFAKRMVQHFETRAEDLKCELCTIRIQDAGPGCPWHDCPHKGFGDGR